MKKLISLAAVIFGLSGCSLFHDDYPTSRSCSDNTDCFQAQGEVCNTMTRTCVQAPDAAPSFDARPMPDAEPAPDAESADAETPDAT